MEEKEFINWVRGFTQGVHHYSLTPKQWDYFKEKLSEVGKESNSIYIIDSRYWTTTVA